MQFLIAQNLKVVDTIAYDNGIQTSKVQNVYVLALGLALLCVVLDQPLTAHHTELTMSQGLVSSQILGFCLHWRSRHQHCIALHDMML